LSRSADGFEDVKVATVTIEDLPAPITVKSADIYDHAGGREWIVETEDLVSAIRDPTVYRKRPTENPNPPEAQRPNQGSAHYALDAAPQRFPRG
jgi:hypothetical protein